MGQVPGPEAGAPRLCPVGPAPGLQRVKDHPSTPSDVLQVRLSLARPQSEDGRVRSEPDPKMHSQADWEEQVRWDQGLRIADRRQSFYTQSAPRNVLQKATSGGLGLPISSGLADAGIEGGASLCNSLGSWALGIPSQPCKATHPRSWDGWPPL